ncbi:MAG: cation transporter [Anaerolineales bacterium]|nr:cation transporter [Anaerolineales bacterium]
MDTLNLTLPAVTCGHCKMSVEREVGAVDGVVSVVVTVENKRAVIEYAGPATNDGIETVLTEIGYPPKDA